MDRARSPLVNNPAEPVEHDPDELKSVPGTASHKGPRSLTPLRIPGFGTRIRYEGSHLGLPTNLWRGYAPVHRPLPEYHFDLNKPAFVYHPHPFLAELRDNLPVFLDPPWGQ